MISFSNVSVKYPLGNIALHNITFEVPDNSFTYIVGPSGAGKTTILNLILREYIPSSGKIVVDDEEISSEKFKNVTLLRQKIGVVFQDFRILMDKSIFENVALGLHVKGINPYSVQKQVLEALEETGISDKAHLFPIQLSAGELQRVAIARAILGGRDIILADEPTGNLDPKTTWEIMKIFKKLEKEKTILFATHNTDVVNSMKRRVLVVKGGKLVDDKEKGGYSI